MEYINPIFKDVEITKLKVENNIELAIEKKKRATRKDKTHNIKFPVTKIERMKLRTYCKQVSRAYKLQNGEEITQTIFNTLLLKFGLRHGHLLRYDFPYKDSKQYMHTNLLETEYQEEIGGPHGLTVRKGLSDRKVVYFIILSVLKWFESGGDIEKIL